MLILQPTIYNNTIEYPLGIFPEIYRLGSRKVCVTNNMLSALNIFTFNESTNKTFKDFSRRIIFSLEEATKGELYPSKAQTSATIINNAKRSPLFNFQSETLMNAIKVLSKQLHVEVCMNFLRFTLHLPT